MYPLQRALRNLDSPAYDYSLPTRAAQFRSDVRLVREYLAQIVGLKAANFVLRRGLGLVLAVCELIFISLVIELSLALPMAWYFHRTTTMSLPANVLVIPASVLMPAAVVAVALSYVSFGLAHALGLIAGYSLALLTGTIRLIGQFRISDLRLSAPALATCLAAAMAVALALLLARRRLWLAWVGVAGLLAAAVAIVYVPAKMEWASRGAGDHRNRRRAGDSLLIITPQGKTVLLDSGGRGWREPFRFRRGRGSGLTVFVEPRHSPTRRGGELAPTFGPYRGHAERHCQLPAQ